MPKETTQILDSRQISQKLVRMAHEIHERNFREKEIILIGIVGRGSEVAARLLSILQPLCGFPVTGHTIELDKDNPLKGQVRFSGEVTSLKGKNVILVDDVLNSGRTLIYAAKFLLDAEPHSLSTAVLIDRFHRRFPVRADYVGLTLSTNLKEHVTVEMAKGKEGAYLE